MQCKYCEAELESDSLFCTFCGIRVEASPPPPKPKVQKPEVPKLEPVSTEALFKKVRAQLEYGEFEAAAATCRRISEIDMEIGELWVCRLLVEHACKSLYALSQKAIDVTDSDIYRNVLKYASDEAKAEVIAAAGAAAEAADEKTAAEKAAAARAADKKAAAEKAAAARAAEKAVLKKQRLALFAAIFSIAAGAAMLVFLMVSVSADSGWFYGAKKSGGYSRYYGWVPYERYYRDDFAPLARWIHWVLFAPILAMGIVLCMKRVREKTKGLAIALIVFLSVAVASFALLSVECDFNRSGYPNFWVFIWVWIVAVVALSLAAAYLHALKSVKAQE
ncbi:MAG: hypothetical protein FWE62_05035 [Firmicutes bacterium]|nr:hypothetical protein [Bacillota bacterium]